MVVLGGVAVAYERGAPVIANAGAAGRPDLIPKKVFIKSFCTSQFLHKFVNDFFMIVIMKDKLTNLSGN